MSHQRIEAFWGKRVHMIGIGGSSMSGLAGLLCQLGCGVTGSDNYDSYLAKKVRESGIPVAIGHRAENVQGADLVIFSAAIAEDNPERLEARGLGIPEMERSTLLGQLMEGYPQAVGVAGTHGKTTTTAMLAQILIDTGKNPTVHLGGSFDKIGGGTRIGGKGVFIAEACEFNESFLEMRPTIAVVLNIEEDHLDYYRDINHIAQAFGQFIGKVPDTGFFLGNGDDPRIQALMQGVSCACITFGLGPKNKVHPLQLTYDDRGCAQFDVSMGGRAVAHISLEVGGSFNAINALAALTAAQTLGVDPTAAAASLSSFQGVHRRLEYTGTVRGVRLYHDYGHNPTEMKGALSVIKMQPHNRLWAVMQPHTYSRVKRLFSQYIHCCEDADEILITDIYAAREKDPGDIHTGMLLEAIEKTGQSVHWTPTFGDTEAYLRAHWQPGDVVLTMGCGNINELNEQIQREG